MDKFNKKENGRWLHFATLNAPSFREETENNVNLHPCCFGTLSEGRTDGREDFHVGSNNLAGISDLIKLDNIHLKLLITLFWR